MYNNSWKDLLHDDNRQGAFCVLNLNKPCYWLFNGRFRNYHYCCIVVSLIWDRRPSSAEGIGGLYLSIDARGERDLRHPISSSIRSCYRHGVDDVYNHPTKWISKIESNSSPGHYKGLLFYPIPSNHDLRMSLYGDLYFSYANSIHDGDYESITIVEGNWDSLVWDSYITYDQMKSDHESEENKRKRWDGVFPLKILERTGWWV
jgi:hypothetical protein